MASLESRRYQLDKPWACFADSYNYYVTVIIFNPSQPSQICGLKIPRTKNKFQLPEAPRKRGHRTIFDTLDDAVAQSGCLIDFVYKLAFKPQVDRDTYTICLTYAVEGKYDFQHRLGDDKRASKAEWITMDGFKKGLITPKGKATVVPELQDSVEKAMSIVPERVMRIGPLHTLGQSKAEDASRLLEDVDI